MTAPPQPAPSAGAACFALTIDGKRVRMIAPSGTRLEDALASAKVRFGAHRVTAIESSQRTT